jgi:hypothetical protein
MVRIYDLFRKPAIQRCPPLYAKSAFSGEVRYTSDFLGEVATSPENELWITGRKVQIQGRSNAKSAFSGEVTSFSYLKKQSLKTIMMHNII